VLVCGDGGEVSAALQDESLGGGATLFYSSSSDLLRAQPAAGMVLVVFGQLVPLEQLGRLLRWARHRWPRCCMAVIGQAGQAGREMAARCGGALYLVPPDLEQQVSQLAEHLLGEPVEIGGRLEDTRG
jgi:hypothetical protein